MRIIITGATGALGAYLTRYFSLKGNEVIAHGRDKNPPVSLLKYASYFQADITRPFRFPEADVCIHAAAVADDKANSEELYNPNVLGTQYVAEAAKQCKIFIHISSSSVYLPEDIPITEEMAGEQNDKLLSPYGKSKLLSEKALIKTSLYESCYILRPRALYGAGDKVILPRILKLVKKNIFNRPGKMEIAVSMTHYENIAHAIQLCINSKKEGVNIYNIADDKTYILVEIIRKIVKELYNKELPEKEIKVAVLKLLAFFKIGGITPLLVRSFTKNMVLDITKIKKELNYSPSVNFDIQLKEMGEWVRSIGGVEVIKHGNKKLAWE